MKYAKRPVSAIAVLFLILLSGVFSAAWADIAGTLTALEGRVDILRPGEDRATPAKLFDKVSVGDIIRTKSKSKAEITFVDDSVIRLAAGSRLEIQEYLFSGGERKSGVVKLFRGKARSIIKRQKGEKVGRFQVKTPTAVAGVRGTDFFVFHQLGLTGVMVVNGIVDVFNLDIPDVVVTLTAGTATTVEGDKPPTPPRGASEGEGGKHEDETTPLEDDGEGGDGEGEGSADEGGSGEGTDATRIAAIAPSGVVDPVDTGTPETPIEPVIVEPDLIPYEGETGDTTAPTVNITSGPTLITTTTTAGFTVTTNEDPTTFSYTLDGDVVGGLNLVGLAPGVHIFRAAGADEAGNIGYDSYTWFSGTAGSTFTGNSYGTGSTFTGTALAGDVYMGTSTDGSWMMDIAGDWVGPSGATWNIDAGGDGFDDTGLIWEGYWVNQMEGTYGSPVSGVAPMSGPAGLLYITEDYIASGAGTATGSVDTGAGTFALGVMGFDTYAEIPLLFDAGIDGTFLHSSAGNIEGDPASPVVGLMGGVDPLWTGTPGVLFIGQYENPGASRYFSALLEGGTSDGGALLGYIGGVSPDAENIRVLAGLLYVKDDGEGGNTAGYALSDNIAGIFYPELGMWETTGTFSTVDTGPTTATPGELFDGSVSIDQNSGNNPVVGDITGTLALESFSIEDQDSGILVGAGEGLFTATPSASWSARTGGTATDGPDSSYYITEITGTSWAGDNMGGTFAGTALSADSITDFSGDIQGVYEVTGSGNWQAVMLGTTESSPILFGGDVDGEFLEAQSPLVGSGTLTGFMGSDLPFNPGGTTSLLMMGDYTNPCAARIVAGDLSGTTADGGTYLGLMLGLAPGAADTTFDAIAAGLYINPDGVGGYTVGTFLNGSPIDGSFFSELGMWSATMPLGTFATDEGVTTTVPGDLYDGSPELFYNAVDGRVGGDINGHLELDSLMVDGMAGPVLIGAGGGFFDTTPGPGAWAATAGGSIDAGNPCAPVGLWVSNISGSSWAGDEFAATISGHSIDQINHTTFTGDIFGIYEITGSGNWQAATTGRAISTPLAFVNEVGAEIYSTTLLHEGAYTYSDGGKYEYSFREDGSFGFGNRRLNDASYVKDEYQAGGTYRHITSPPYNSTTSTWDPALFDTTTLAVAPAPLDAGTVTFAFDNVTPVGSSSGLLNGYMGGVDSLWVGTDIAVDFVGEYENTGSSIFYDPNIISHDYITGEGSTYAGGTYRGIFAGIDLATSLDGNFLGIYIAPSTEVGFLHGSLSGAANPAIGMADMTGLLNRTPVAPSPSPISLDFATNFIEGNDIWTTGFAGTFDGGGAIAIPMWEGWGNSISLVDFTAQRDIGWGIYGLELFGGYDTPTPTWTAITGGEAEFGLLKHNVRRSATYDYTDGSSYSYLFDSHNEYRSRDTGESTFTYPGGGDTITTSYYSNGTTKVVDTLAGTTTYGAWSPAAFEQFDLETIPVVAGETSSLTTSDEIDAHDRNYGFWLASVSDGTLTEGRLDGTLSGGHYMTYSSLGTLDGTLLGTINPTLGTFDSAIVGTRADTIPLTHMTEFGDAIYKTRRQIETETRYTNGEYYTSEHDLSNIEGAYSYHNAAGTSSSMTYNNGGDTFGYDSATGLRSYGFWDPTSFDLSTLATLPVPPAGHSILAEGYEPWDLGWYIGWQWGYMGGTDTLWSGVDIPGKIMGEFGDSITPYPGQNMNGVFYHETLSSTNELVRSGDPAENMTFDGGAYVGDLGGIRIGSSLEGAFIGLYVDPAGNAGVLTGDFLGTQFTDISLFEMDGLFNRQQIEAGASTNTPASALNGSLIDDWSFAYGIQGDFAGSGSLSSGASGSGWGNIYTFNDRVGDDALDWGTISFMDFGHASSPGPDWDAVFAGSGRFGIYNAYTTYEGRLNYTGGGEYSYSYRHDGSEAVVHLIRADGTTRDVTYNPDGTLGVVDTLLGNSSGFWTPGDDLSFLALPLELPGGETAYPDPTDGPSASDTGTANEGYYLLSVADGTLVGERMAGTSTGRYISERTLGTIDGDLLGTYDHDVDTFEVFNYGRWQKTGNLSHVADLRSETNTMAHEHVGYFDDTSSVSGSYEYTYHEDNSFGMAKLTRADGTYTQVTYSPNGRLDVVDTGGAGNTSNSWWDRGTMDLSTLATPPTVAGMTFVNLNTIDDYLIYQTSGSSLDGLMGEIPSLWTGPGVGMPITALGQYSGNYNGVFYQDFVASNDYTQGNNVVATYDGGAYVGLLGGADVSSRGVLDGLFYAIYMDPAGDSGILSSTDLAGTSYRDAAAFELDGTVTREQFATSAEVGLTPADMGFAVMYGSMTGTLTAEFDGGASLNVTPGFSASETLSIVNNATLTGQEWGIYGISLFGTMGTQTTTWSGIAMGQGDFGRVQSGAVMVDDPGYWYADVTSGTFASEAMSAELLGMFITDNKAGIIEGRMRGSYNDGLDTFQLASLGKWEALAPTFWGDITGGQFYDLNGGLVTPTALTSLTGRYAGGFVTPHFALSEGILAGDAVTIGKKLFTADVTGASDIGAVMAGHMVGVDDALTASIATIYIAPDGGGGQTGGLYQSRSINGEFQPTQIWAAGASFSETDKGPVDVAAANLATSIWTTSYIEPGIGTVTGGSLEGDFLGSGSILGDVRISTNSIYNNATHVTAPWGTFEMAIDSKGFLNPLVSSTWNGQARGWNAFGAYWDPAANAGAGGFTDDFGFWSVDMVNGNWNADGTLTAETASLFMTPYKLGIVTGDLFGVHETGVAGELGGLGVGTWESDWLAFSAILQNGATAWADGPVNGIFGDNGAGGFADIDNLWVFAGSAIAPWDCPATSCAPQSTTVNYLGMLGYDLAVISPGTYIWDSELEINDYAEPGRTTTYDGGSFLGFTGGLLSDGTVDGRVASIYIDPEGNVGYLTGTIDGVYDPATLYAPGGGDYFMMDASGPWNPTQMVSAGALGLGPANFYNNVRTSAGLTATLSGEFTGPSGSIDGAAYSPGVGEIAAWTRYIDGEPWGIFDVALDGYPGAVNPCGETTWTGFMGGEGVFGSRPDGGGGFLDNNGYYLTYASPGSWDAAKVTATLDGDFMTAETFGRISGDLIGYYDASGNWAGKALGVFDGATYGFVTGLNNSFYHFYDGDDTIWDRDSISGYFGSIASPFTIPGTPVSFMAMGKVSGIWSQTWWDNFSGTGSAWDGFIGGNRSFDNKTISGGVASFYIANDGSAGILDATLDGTIYPGSIFKVDGTDLKATEKTASGYIPANFNTYLATSAVNGEITGEFAGGTGSISTVGFLQDIAFNASGTRTQWFVNPGTAKDEPWGIYKLELGGYYTNPAAATTFDMTLGGNNWRAATDYWIMDIAGNWNADQTVDGTINGRYLNLTSLGSINSGMWGSYDTDTGGVWEGVALGTFEETPLAFSGEITFATDWDTGPWWGLYGNDGLGAFDAVDDFYGVAGSLENPWDCTAGCVPQTIDVVYMGQPCSVNNQPLIWNNDLYAFDVKWNEGAFSGFIGGALLDGAATGGVRLIYLDPDGNVGYIEGTLLGDYYGESSMIPFSADGQWVATEVSDSLGYDGVDPVYAEYLHGDLGRDPYFKTTLSGGFGAGGASGFINGVDFNGDFATYGYRGWTRYIDGEDWGIFDVIIDGYQGGGYSNPNPDSTFSGLVGGSGNFGSHFVEGPSYVKNPGYWLADVNGTVTNRNLDGTAVGTFMTREAIGPIWGDLYGYHEGAAWGGKLMGVFEGDPVAYSGELLTGGTFFNTNLSPPTESDSITGLMGSLNAINPGGSTDIDLLGEYLNPNGLRLFGADFEGTASDGTAFLGIYAGLDRQGTLDGVLGGIYIRPDGVGGHIAGTLLADDLAGEFLPDLGMWRASSANFIATDLGATAELPGDLFSGGTAFDDSEVNGLVGGDIFGNMLLIAQSVVDIDSGLLIGITGGLFGTNPAPGWTAHGGGTVNNGGLDPDDLWLAQITGSAWAAGNMDGTYSGFAMNPNEMTNFSGDLRGQYEVTGSGNWQAISIGTFGAATPLNFFAGLTPRFWMTGDFNWVEQGFLNGDTYDYSYESGTNQGFGRYAPLGVNANRVDTTFFADGTTESFDRVTGLYSSGTWNEAGGEAAMAAWYGTPDSSVPSPSAFGVEAMGGWFDIYMGSTTSLWPVTTPTPTAVPVTVLAKHIGSDWQSGEPRLIYEGARYLRNDPTWGATFNDYDGGAFRFGLVGMIEADDTIDPDIVGLYIDPAGNAGLLNGVVTGTAYTDIGMAEMAGQITPRQMAMAAEVGVLPASLDSSIYRSGISNPVSMLSGTLPGGGALDSTIYEIGSSTIVDYSGPTVVQQWGTLNYVFEAGGFANPGAATTWSATMGGYDPFGPDATGLADELGYWLADTVGGTIGDRTLRADFSGNFITPTKLGTIDGSLYGLYDTAVGEWGGRGLATYESDPLLYAGEITPILMTTSAGRRDIYNYSDGSIHIIEIMDDNTYARVVEQGTGYHRVTSYFSNGKVVELDRLTGAVTETTWNPAVDVLSTILTPPTGYTGSTLTPGALTTAAGKLDMLMGGIDSLWSGTPNIPVTMMGEYDYNSGAPYIFRDWFVDSPAFPEIGFTTYDGGDYAGAIAGGIALDESMEAHFAALYLDSSGNAGLIYDPVSGNADSSIDIFNMAGGLNPYQMATAAEVGADPNVDLYWTQSGGLGDRLAGWFPDGDTTADMSNEYYRFRTLSLTNSVTGTVPAQPWGIFTGQFKYGAATFANPGVFNTWYGGLAGMDPIGAYWTGSAFADDPGIYAADIINGNWADGSFDGEIDGWFMTPNKMGPLAGNIYGLYDELDGVWGAYTIGTWEGAPYGFVSNFNNSFYHFDNTPVILAPTATTMLDGYLGSFDSPFATPGIGVNFSVMGQGVDAGSQTWFGQFSGTGSAWDGWTGGHLSNTDDTINGIVNALYIDDVGNAGILGANFFGDLLPNEVFVASGTNLTATQKATGGYTAGLFNIYLQRGRPEGGIGGGFPGQPGYIGSPGIQGLVSVESETRWFDNGTIEPWGIYKIELGGDYANPNGATGFEISLGGSGWKNLNNWQNPNTSTYFSGDNWYADITGNWNTDGTLDGTINGRFLTPFALGTINSEAWGSYDTVNAGFWEGLVLGEFYETPLAFAGIMDFEDVGTWADGPNWSLFGEYASAFKEVGDIIARTGGLDEPWDCAAGLCGPTAAPVDVTILGEVIDWDNEVMQVLPNNASYVWNTELYSWNEGPQTRTTFDGGAFRGFAGGVLIDDGVNFFQEVDGYSVALYIDPEGNVGYLKGDVAGNYYFDMYGDERDNLGAIIESYSFSLLNADGTLQAYEMKTPGNHSITSAASFYSEVVTSATLDTMLWGGFPVGGGNFDATDYNPGGDGWTRYIPGESWGIFDIILNGYPGEYDNMNNDTTWMTMLGGSGTFGSNPDGVGGYFDNDGYWTAWVLDGTAVNGKLTGSISSGRWMTSTHLGNIWGDILGYYDGPGNPTPANWAGKALGVFDGDSLAFSGRITTEQQAWITGPWQNGPQAGIFGNDWGENFTSVGDVGAFAGSLTPLWNCTAGPLACGPQTTNVTYMGEIIDLDADLIPVLDSFPNRANVWNNDLLSHNLYNSTFTTFDGGSFYGFIGGVLMKGLTDSHDAEGIVASLYYDPEGNIGYFTGGLNGSYNYYIPSSYMPGPINYHYSVLNADGTWTPTEKVAAGGHTITSAALFTSEVITNPYMTASLEGSFGAGENGYIYGKEHNQEPSYYAWTRYVPEQPWGLFDIVFNGYMSSGQGYQNPLAETTWQTWMGGEGRFGYFFDDGAAGFDYWGLWSADTASSPWGELNEENYFESGSLSGRYLTFTHTGSIWGDIVGYYEDPLIGGNPEDWAAKSVGVFEGEQLAFSGEISFSTGWNTGPYFDIFADDGTASALATYDEIWGISGSTQAPWSCSAGCVPQNTDVLHMSQLLASGAYNQDGPLIWNSNITSYERYGYTYQTYDGGSFDGFIGGLLLNGNVDARVANVYMDPAGNAGYIWAVLDGRYGLDLTDIGINTPYRLIEADGLWQPTQMATFAEVDFTPANFQSTGIVTNADMNAGVSGIFGAGNGMIDGVEYRSGTPPTAAWTRYLDGQQWGVYDQILDGYDVTLGGGTYSNPLLDPTFSIQIGGVGVFGSIETSPFNYVDNWGWYYGEVNDGPWTGGTLLGNYAGSWMSQRYIGDIWGDVLGYYDTSLSPNDGNWTAKNIGIFTGDPLAFSGESYEAARWEEGPLNATYTDVAGSFTDLATISPRLHAGSVDAPWSCPGGVGTCVPSVTDVLYLGDVDNTVIPYLAQPLLWNQNLKSYNIDLLNDTTFDGGSFSGFIGGLWAGNDIDATAVSLYIDPDGNVGWFTGDLAGQYYMDIIAFGTRQLLYGDGQWTATQMNSFGNHSISSAALFTAEVVTDSTMDADLFGWFGGGSGSIYATEYTDNATYSAAWTRYINGESWGIYDMILDGYPAAGSFTNPVPDTTLTAAVGGGGVFGSRPDGFGGYNPETGFWLAYINGPSWQNNVVDTDMSGLYVSETTYGTIDGRVIGYYDNAGNWAAKSLGVFEGAPLDAWANMNDYLQYFDTTLQQEYQVQANLGLHGATFDFVGQYMDFSAGMHNSVTLNTFMTSWNNIDSNSTTYTGDSFKGLLGMRDTMNTAEKGDVDIEMIALELTSAGNLGFVKLSGSGESYYTPETVLVQGGVTHIPIELTALNLSTFASNVLTFNYSPTIKVGAFGGGGAITPVDVTWVDVEYDNGAFFSDYGPIGGLMGGSYTGPATGNWTIDTKLTNYLASDSAILHTRTEGTGGWSPDSAFTGKTHAYGAETDASEAMTWIAVGDTMGNTNTFNPGAITKFQAVTTGAWFRTDQFLEMIGVIAGTANTAALDQLNIPHAEVALMTMFGAGNGIDVTLNNMKFYGYSAGQAPKIFATEDVTGNITGTPTTGNPFTINAVSGGAASAQFEIQQWDTGVTQKWLGTIDGGTGTLSGGTYTGPVNFTGAAAGDISTGTGTFSGTAAGIATP